MGGELFKMYIINRHFNNRAVSNIIAALLLIAIAVAAAVLLYVFSIGLLGSLGSSGGQQTKEQVIMEAYNWAAPACPTASISLTLRNVGPASVNLSGDSGGADFFVNGSPMTFSGTDTALAPGSSTSGTLGGNVSPCISGAAYPLKIVTPTGGVFSYSVIAGSAS